MYELRIVYKRTKGAAICFFQYQHTPHTKPSLQAEIAQLHRIQKVAMPYPQELHAPRLLQFDSPNHGETKTAYHILHRPKDDSNCDMLIQGITTDEEMHKRILGDFKGNVIEPFVTSPNWTILLTSRNRDKILAEYPIDHSGLEKSTRGFIYSKKCKLRKLGDPVIELTIIIVRNALIAAGYEWAD